MTPPNAGEPSPCIARITSWLGIMLRTAMEGLDEFGVPTEGKYSLLL